MDLLVRAINWCFYIFKHCVQYKYYKRLHHSTVSNKKTEFHAFPPGSIFIEKRTNPSSFKGYSTNYSHCNEAPERSNRCLLGGHLQGFCGCSGLELRWYQGFQAHIRMISLTSKYRKRRREIYGNPPIPSTVHSSHGWNWMSTCFFDLENPLFSFISSHCMLFRGVQKS